MNLEWVVPRNPSVGPVRNLERARSVVLERNQKSPVDLSASPVRNPRDLVDPSVSLARSPRSPVDLVVLASESSHSINLNL